jgi:hypothetical protein
VENSCGANFSDLWYSKYTSHDSDAIGAAEDAAPGENLRVDWELSWAGSGHGGQEKPRGHKATPAAPWGDAGVA